MTYLKRKIDSYLVSWKEDPDRLPLIVKGPRQVGKTASVLHFAQQYYKSVVYMNFVEEPKYRTVISDGYSAASIVRNISLLDPSFSFPEGNTLLVFDEVQEFPQITTALKFFKLDGRYDVICSGSMLGLNYRVIESNSVGYKTDVEMSSLDFEEFLWALGYPDDVRDDLLRHMVELRPFSDTENKVFFDRFLEYAVLGGMPAVVSSFVEKKTFEGSLARQRQLIADYKEDIVKYAEGLDQARILNVFEHLPVQLAKESKKFQISKVKSGARFKDYRGCVEWLKNSGIILVCYCLSYPELPLKGNYDERKYKLYMSDVGLFVSMLDEEAQEDLRANRNMDVYKGALYENIVGAALVKEGYSLFYYAKENSTLEEDFFVRTGKSLVPVEVKSTNGQSKSMRELIDSDRYPDIRFGVKLAHANIGMDRDLYTFPYFCSFLMKDWLASLDR